MTFTEAIIEESPFGDDDYWVRTWLMGDLIDESGPLDPDGDTLSLGIQSWVSKKPSASSPCRSSFFRAMRARDLCEANAWPDEPTIGSGGCDYWAYAEFDGGSLDLDDRPDDATSWTHHTMQRYLVLPAAMPSHQASANPSTSASSSASKSPTSNHLAYSPTAPGVRPGAVPRSRK